MSSFTSTSFSVLKVFGYVFKHRKGLRRMNRIYFANGEMDRQEYVLSNAVIALCSFVYIDAPILLLLFIIAIFRYG